MRLTSFGLLSTIATGKSLFTFTNGHPAEGLGQRDKIVDNLDDTRHHQTPIDGKLSYVNDNSNVTHCKNEFNFSNRAHYGSREQTKSSILPIRYLENIKKEPKVFLSKPPENQCECGLKMVILVKSALEHSDRRQKIREKWKIDEDIRINFLVGKNLKNQVTTEVREEADRHKDLIIGDFIDTYRNLTMKSTLGLQWGAEECKNYGSMLMVDDDIQMQLDVILDRFAQPGKQTIPELEIIRCLHQLQPKPKALRSGKWKVRMDQYDHDRYPASCTGPAILMSNRAVKILHDTASSTEEDFPIDDIFISGILREKSNLKIQRPLARDEQLVRVIRESELEKNQTIASQIL